MDRPVKKLIDLLNSGDDEGCDVLVVVSRKEFVVVREAVKELTGVTLRGCITCPSRNGLCRPTADCTTG